MSYQGTDSHVTATPHERRVARRLEARGDDGLAEVLLRMKGLVAGGRYQLGQLYAVGAEGAVYDVADTANPNAAPLVAKLALLPIHRPFDLEPTDIRRRRYGLRVESQYLLGNSSPFMPNGIGLFEIGNPLLDTARGDAFAEPEPVLIMEKLPGLDLDRWLARTHRSPVDRVTMRRTLDRIAVVLVQALTDLRRRGLYYADLRPGNMRMMGRPQRRVRMLDAGSLVSIHDKSGRFPHVPAYLPPDTYLDYQRGRRIVPSDAVQAVMAGRTLYECATGNVPRPGQRIDLDALDDCNVSDPVASIIRKLCTGEFTDVRTALRSLYANATRRVARGNDPSRSESGQFEPIESGDHSDAAAEAVARSLAADTRTARTAPATFSKRRPEPVDETNDQILPPARKRPSLLRRLFGRLLRK